MLISLMFMSVLTINQPDTAFDLLGSWSEHEAKTIVFDSFPLGGGEDFGSIKFRRKSKPKPRQFEFNKDGTGKYLDEGEEFTFRFVTGEANSKEHYVFIAFDQPFLEEEKPLVVFSAKIINKGQIVLTAVKKNSPLGDRIRHIAFDRQQAPAAK